LPDDTVDLAHWQ